MLHIIIVLGGTVFTEGGHFTSELCVVGDKIRGGPNSYDTSTFRDQNIIHIRLNIGIGRDRGFAESL